MNDKYAVILAGGSGERFWPLSRKDNPKQFLPILGGKPMILQTIERLEGIVDQKNIYVITNLKHRKKIIEICTNIDPNKVIGEPIGRDTAPAVALASILIGRENPNAVFAILPSDAYIDDNKKFCSVMNSAFSLAKSQKLLVTIGIRPTYASTGYGYIKISHEIGEYEKNKAYRVDSFKEKPVLNKAKEYLQSEKYFWNSGIFIWSQKIISSELNKNCLNLWSELINFSKKMKSTNDMIINLDKIYNKLEKISIDYAVIEKAQNIAMFQSSFGWDDLGDWVALERHNEKDENNNSNFGRNKLIESSNSIIFNKDPNHLIATLAIDNLIVVKTKDVTLICKKESAQSIKKIVHELSGNSQDINFI